MSFHAISPELLALARISTNIPFRVLRVGLVLSLLANSAAAQDMIFTTVVDDGDPIESPGADPSATVSSIGYAQWSDEALGVRTLDSVSRTFAAFWYPSVGELEYVAGAQTPFADFEPTDPTTNREGNPPGSPFLASAFGFVNNSDEFVMQTTVDDADTFLTESWPTLITAGPGTGIQQFAQRYLTPVAMAPTEYAFYVTDIDLEEKHGWVTTGGSVEILIDSETPIPAELNNATFFFWSEPTKILNDRTSIHATSYNGNPGGTAIYTMTPAGAIDILVDSNGDVPIDFNLPDGGSWSSNFENLSANDSGRILFQAGVVAEGVFNRSTLWTIATGDDEPTLEVSSFVNYPTVSAATVTFDSVRPGFIDNAGNILFQARVDGESKFGVWRKLITGDFNRISPVEDSPLPGVPDFIAQSSSIADMNTDGRCVLQVQGTGARSITAYYLESSTNSLVYILTAGLPFGPNEESVSVTSLDLSNTGAVAILLRVDVPNTFNDDDRVVVARDPDDLQPSGNQYLWDGGAGTSNWHTVVDGRSNWVDSQGVPWDVPPDSADAQVEIGIDAVVQLDQAIQLFSIDLAKGSLEIDAALACNGIVLVQEDASLVLQGFELDATQIVSEGLILKEGDKTFSLTGQTLSVDDSEFIVEDGLLRLWCDTTLDSSTLRVEGGTVNTGTLQFEGDNPRIEVLAGATVEIESPQLTFMSDTTFSTEDGGSIKIGDSENQASITTNFETDVPSEIRVIEFTGSGTIEVFDALEIPANTILRNKSGSGSSAGLIFDTYEGDDLEETTVNGSLTNTGSLEIKNGGILGNFENRGLTRVTNGNYNALPILLNCANFGDLQLESGDIAYDELIFESGSKLILDQDTLRTIFPYLNLTEKELRFEEGSSIQVNTGNTVMEFVSDELPNFGAALNIQEGASLEIHDANASGISSIINFSTGYLKFKNLKVYLLAIVSNGVVELTGNIQGTNDPFTLALLAPSFTVKDAKLIGGIEEPPVASFFSFGSSTRTKNGEATHLGSFENVVFENNAALVVAKGAQIVTEGTFSLSNRADVFGDLILSGDASEDPFVGEASIFLGDETENGTLQILSLPNQPISIEPDVFFVNKQSTVITGANTTATMTVGVYNEFIQPGILDFGNWVVGDFGSLTLTNLPEIEIIGNNATVELNKPHATLGSLSDLPTPNKSLTVLGKLTLNDTTLDMGGKILRNKGTLKGKVIGDVESIRGDVQGVIQLAGNIDIEGNLTMDTTLSLGASPGTGRISGDLTLLPGAEMVVEVGGSEPGAQFDFLEVGGASNLDGTLRLSLIDGYLPEVDDTFQFLQSGTISGSFAEIDQREMGRERRYDLNTVSDGLSLTAKSIQISSYADWRSYFFSQSDAADDAISGPLADPDLDQLSNLSEYLHATLPHQSSASPFTFDLSDPNALSADAQWANGILNYEWQLEASTTLESWETIPFTSEQIEDLGDKAIHRIQSTPTQSEENETRFYRFKAIQRE